MDRRELQIKGGRLQHRALTGLYRRLGRFDLCSVEVDGVVIPYHLGGTGPPILMLHGFGDQKETWSPIAPMLSRKFTIIAPDLPGYGRASSIEPEDATLAGHARFMLRFLDKFGRRRVHIVGNSMGGGIALQLAKRHPNRVSSLTLLASMGPEVETSEARALYELGKNPLVPRSFEEYEEMIAFVFSRRPPFPRGLLHYMAEIHEARCARYAEYFDILINCNDDARGVPTDLSDIRAPSLVVHGARDRVIHPATSAELARLLPRARSTLLPGVGHGVQWEAPRATWRLIHDHIERAVKRESFEREER